MQGSLVAVAGWSDAGGRPRWRPPPSLPARPSSAVPASRAAGSETALSTGHQVRLEADAGVRAAAPGAAAVFGTRIVASVSKFCGSLTAVCAGDPGPSSARAAPAKEVALEPAGLAPGATPGRTRLIGMRGRSRLPSLFRRGRAHPMIASPCLASGRPFPFREMTWPASDSRSVLHGGVLEVWRSRSSRRMTGVAAAPWSMTDSRTVRPTTAQSCCVQSSKWSLWPSA